MREQEGVVWTSLSYTAVVFGDVSEVLRKAWRTIQLVRDAELLQYIIYLHGKLHEKP